MIVYINKHITAGIFILEDYIVENIFFIILTLSHAHTRAKILGLQAPFVGKFSYLVLQTINNIEYVLIYQ